MEPAEGGKKCQTAKQDKAASNLPQRLLCLTFVSFRLVWGSDMSGLKHNDFPSDNIKEVTENFFEDASK